MIMKMRGFSLVEVVIATGTALVVGVILVAILISNTGLSYKQSALVNEGLSLNDALQKIDENIRQAASVAPGYPLDTPQYISGGETLVLKLPALGVNDVINGVYDYAVIRKESTGSKILKLQTFPDPSSRRKAQNLVLTTILDSIIFYYLNDDLVEVTPVSSKQVKVSLSVLSQTGSVGSSRTSISITSLRN